MPFWTQHNVNEMAGPSGVEHRVRQVVPWVVRPVADLERMGFEEEEGFAGDEEWSRGNMGGLYIVPRSVGLQDSTAGDRQYNRQAIVGHERRIEHES
jgi:hypothetical protein